MYRLTYQVTASFGELYQTTTELTVHFFSRALPYYTGIAGSYSLGIGDQIELHTHYEGYGWDEAEYRGCFVMEEEFEDIITYELIHVDQPMEDYLVITGNRAGVLTVHFRTNQDGMNWNGTVTFMVNTESGQLPPISSSLNLPMAVKTIEEEAFMGTNVQRINVNSGCERIESRAFADCGELLILSLPSSVTSIADDILSGSDKLSFIIAPENSYARTWAQEHELAIFEE